MSALGDELRDCANEMQLCIHEFRVMCEENQIDPYRARDTAGQPIMAKMLVSYGKVLSVLAQLAEGPSDDEIEYSRRAKEWERINEG